MQDVRDKIISNGWMQGKLVDVETLASSDLVYPNSFDIENVHAYFVVSQTCDIAQVSEDKEPLVECLAVYLSEKLDKMAVNGRNSRLYHYEFEGECFFINIWHIAYVPKVAIVDLDIADKEILPEKITKGISQWRARRYTRAAWPDEFNYRANYFFKGKQWKKLLTNYAASFYGIYLSIEPNEETDVEYGVTFKFVLEDDELAGDEIVEITDEVEEVLQLIDDEEKGIKCLNFSDDFVIHEKTVVAKADFSILDMHRYPRWQDGDYHSADPQNTQSISKEE